MQQQQLRRLQSSTTSTTSTTTTLQQQQQLLEYAIATVRQHDPAAYLPGRLLPNDHAMRTAYFGIRAFWVETGLRFGSTAAVPPNSTPAQHLQWWQDGIDFVFHDGDGDKDARLRLSTTATISTTPSFEKHPVLQLLRSLKEQQGIPWTKQHFDDVLIGRRKDLDVKQYDTMADLIQHAEQSCGSLSQLVLESGHLLENPDANPMAHRAAKLAGICHGLANQLRLSVPVLSTTGKLIIPAELCTKYGVTSPRYLLSALSLGDDTCVRAMQACVRDISEAALAHLVQARELRSAVLNEPNGERAAACLLPTLLPSEAFLHRLERHHYDLTDRNLRHTGLVEHGLCAARIVAAYYQSKY